MLPKPFSPQSTTPQHTPPPRSHRVRAHHLVRANSSSPGRGRAAHAHPLAPALARVARGRNHLRRRLARRHLGRPPPRPQPRPLGPAPPPHHSRLQPPHRLRGTAPPHVTPRDPVRCVSPPQGRSHQGVGPEPEAMKL
eukprot:1251955-Rhodomonas_salina.1